MRPVARKASGHSDWPKGAAAGAETSGQMRNVKYCTLLRREARFQANMYETHTNVGALLEVAKTARY